MEYYTYIHYKADTGEPFYIGKGTGDRVKRSRRRSDYWNNVVKKHGLHYEILSYFDDEDLAFEHEKFLIETFRGLGYKLCNFTDGGEGSSGYKHSEETKLKMRGPRGPMPMERRLKQTDTCSQFVIQATCIDTGVVTAYLGKRALEDSGFNAAHVYKCCDGLRRSHKGYTFAKCEKPF
jgi:hypothetical protein